MVFLSAVVTRWTFILTKGTLKMKAILIPKDVSWLLLQTWILVSIYYLFCCHHILFLYCLLFTSTYHMWCGNTHCCRHILFLYCLLFTSTYHIGVVTPTVATTSCSYIAYYSHQHATCGLVTPTVAPQ